MPWKRKYFVAQASITMAIAATVHDQARGARPAGPAPRQYGRRRGTATKAAMIRSGTACDASGTPAARAGMYASTSIA
jgi:hypothetical protein